MSVKELPVDIDAEQAVCGALIIAPGLGRTQSLTCPPMIFTTSAIVLFSV